MQHGAGTLHRQENAAPSSQPCAESKQLSAEAQERLLALLSDQSRDQLRRHFTRKAPLLLAELHKQLQWASIADATEENEEKGAKQIEMRQKIIDTFEARLSREVSAQLNARATFAQREADSRSAMRIALALTALVAAMTIGIAVFLSDPANLAWVHQRVLYVENALFYSAQSRDFYVDDGEEYSYYA